MNKFGKEQRMLSCINIVLETVLFTIIFKYFKGERSGVRNRISNSNSNILFPMTPKIY